MLSLATKRDNIVFDPATMGCWDMFTLPGLVLGFWGGNASRRGNPDPQPPTTLVRHLFLFFGKENIYSYKFLFTYSTDSS